MDDIHLLSDKSLLTDESFKTIYDALQYNAETRGDEETVIFAAVGSTKRESVTFKQLLEKSERAAKALLKLGKLFCRKTVCYSIVNY